MYKKNNILQYITGGKKMERYLKAKEIATALNISKTGLYLLLQRGDMPKGIRVGRSQRWRESEINSWLKNLEVNNG